MASLNKIPSSRLRTNVSLCQTTKILIILTRRRIAGPNERAYMKLRSLNFLRRNRSYRLFAPAEPPVFRPVCHFSPFHSVFLLFRSHLRHCKPPRKFERFVKGKNRALFHPTKRSQPKDWFRPPRIFCVYRTGSGSRLISKKQKKRKINKKESSPLKWLYKKRTAAVAEQTQAGAGSGALGTESR